MMTGTGAAAIALSVAGAAIVAATGQGTRMGAIAGLGVAVLSILGLGPGALLPLAIFVLGAGALTRLGRSRKLAAGTAEANQGRRGVSHVAAKLGLPALLGVAGILGHGGPPLSFAYAAALAGALADTSGTEIGPLGGGSAFGLREGRFRRLPHGTPGGVSAAGLAASAGGAVAVAWGSTLSGLIGGSAASGIVASAGLGASLLESVIAATPVGRPLGHFGRNAMVSVIASAVGFWAGASGWGRP
jgi:uncharacterized membrane protein